MIGKCARCGEPATHFIDYPDHSDNSRCLPLCRFHARQVAVLLMEYAEGMAVYMPGIERMMA